MDLAFIGAILLFYALSCAFAVGCEQLGGGQP